MSVFDDPVSQLVAYAGKLLWIGIVAAILLWGSRWLRRRVRLVAEEHGQGKNVVALIDKLVSVAVFLVVGLLLLAAITGNTGATVIALALLGAAIAISLRDVLQNFAAGMYFLIEKPFKSGDTIEVDGEAGKVERIDIRTTVLQNSRKEEVFVPNQKVFSEIVKRRPGYAARRYFVRSTDPAHESFEAIWDAALSVQSVDEASASVKITGTRDEVVDFEVTIWEQAGANQSAAFIAAVKSKLPESSVRLLRN